MWQKKNPWKLINEKVQETDENDIYKWKLRSQNVKWEYKWKLGTEKVYESDKIIKYKWKLSPE